MNRFFDWTKAVAQSWDQFWFTPRDGKTLGLIRLLTGLIVFYSHLVWTPLLSTFLGHDGMLPPTYRAEFFDSSFAWSHFDWFASIEVLWVIHIAALIVMLLFALGFWTRNHGNCDGVVCNLLRQSSHRSDVWARSNRGFPCPLFGDRQRGWVLLVSAADWFWS